MTAFSQARLHVSLAFNNVFGEKTHTALKRGLLSARAGSFLSANAGAVVTSAADHLECVVSRERVVGECEDL